MKKSVALVFVSSMIFGCASAPATQVHPKVSTVAPILHDHVPPSDFEMSIGDDAPRISPQLIAAEPTKLEVVHTQKGTLTQTRRAP